ncbi:MAG: hypothetical protein IKS31_12305 [Clostridia bacterium]|nr:hypothetical protein [Clostridia bacterium]MBR4459732.1 hypothetical protein [Clostridia bacterium]
MRLVLCPRCELNYITGDEQYCKVCLQEMRGVVQNEEAELCSICNENPVLPGRDVCAFCLAEMKNGDDQTAAGDEDASKANAGEIVEMDSVSQMDEILPEMKEELGDDYGSIENALSLESVREEEEKEQEEQEQEEEG